MKVLNICGSIFFFLGYIAYGQIDKNLQSDKKERNLEKIKKTDTLFQKQNLIKGKIFHLREIKYELNFFKKELRDAENFLMKRHFRNEKAAENSREITLEEINFISDEIVKRIKDWFFEEKLEMEHIMRGLPENDETKKIYQNYQLIVLYKEDSVINYINNYADSLSNLLDSLPITRFYHRYFFEEN